MANNAMEVDEQQQLGQNLVPENLRMTQVDLDRWINEQIDDNDGEPTWRTLLGIHHAFNHDKADFEGGLSFIKQLIDKLGRFHPNWEYEALKNRVLIAEFPEMEFVLVIQEMLAHPDDIAYYGV